MEDEDDVDMVNMLNDKESPPWEIKIRRADNGFILTKYEHDEEGVTKSEILIEDRDEEHDEDGDDIDHKYMEEYNEAATMKEVYFAIADFFGRTGSKHDMYRLKVDVVKQREDDEDSD